MERKMREMEEEGSSWDMRKDEIGFKYTVGNVLMGDIKRVLFSNIYMN